MNREQIQTLVLLVLLLLTGSAAWWLSLRPDNALDSTALGQLPSSLNGWTAVDIEMDQDVADMLRADANVQRVYRHPHGYWVYVYVGYYGTARGGTPEHTPDACYPAQGWSIEDDDQIRIGGRDGLGAVEFIVEKDGETRLVHFWYRTRDTTGITSTAALQLRNFWGRLAANRGDGALVRLSTVVLDGDLTSARGRLVPMDLAVDDALTGVWPIERSVDG